jgi:hypothetical protein
MFKTVEVRAASGVDHLRAPANEVFWVVLAAKPPKPPKH